jgi:hypothetical protein
LTEEQTPYVGDDKTSVTHVMQAADTVRMRVAELNEMMLNYAKEHDIHFEVRVDMRFFPAQTEDDPERAVDVPVIAVDMTLKL